MRNIIIRLIFICIAVSLCSCANKQPSDTDTTQQTSAVSEEPFVQTGLIDSDAVIEGKPYYQGMGFVNTLEGLIYCNDDRYTYEFETEIGHFAVYGRDKYQLPYTERTKSVTVDGIGYAFWIFSDSEPPYAFIKVLIKSGDDCVGYAVIAAKSDHELHVQWDPIILKCQILSEYDTETQLTSNHLYQLIDEVIKENEPLLIEEYER